MIDEQQYKRIRKKRLRNFLLFYLFIVLFLCFNMTFSKYGTMGKMKSGIPVANWRIKINNEDMEESNEFFLNNTQVVSGAQTMNNKIAPNSNGYFDIILDFAGTEVAIDYKITIDKTILENNGIDLAFTGYSIDSGANIIAIENDTIEGEVLLNNVNGESVKFEEKDNLTIRIYWTWEQDIENPEFTEESLKFRTNVIVKQKIGVE